MFCLRECERVAAATDKSLAGCWLLFCSWCCRKAIPPFCRDVSLLFPPYILLSGRFMSSYWWCCCCWEASHHNNRNCPFLLTPSRALPSHTIAGPLQCRSMDQPSNRTTRLPPVLKQPSWYHYSSFFFLCPPATSSSSRFPPLPFGCSSSATAAIFMSINIYCHHSDRHETTGGDDDATEDDRRLGDWHQHCSGHIEACRPLTMTLLPLLSVTRRS